MLSENGDVIEIDTTGRQTTRPWVSKMEDRRCHVASLLIGIVVWTGVNDTKTISVDANLFETDWCGQGLNEQNNSFARAFCRPLQNNLKWPSSALSVERGRRWLISCISTWSLMASLHILLEHVFTAIGVTNRSGQSWISLVKYKLIFH